MSPQLDSLRAEFGRLDAAEREGWLNRRWDCEQIPDDDPDLPEGCVPYLPCPVASIADALTATEAGEDDVFVDIGSGLGRAAFAAHLLTGARCRGIEIQRHLFEAAVSRASKLLLEGLSFVEGDAGLSLDAVGDGSVFFMYCPFGARRIEHALQDLERIARARPIRLCTVGVPPLARPWLRPLPSSPHVEAYCSQR